jgi:hypothetical protein
VLAAKPNITALSQRKGRVIFFIKVGKAVYLSQSSVGFSKKLDAVIMAHIPNCSKKSPPMDGRG